MRGADGERMKVAISSTGNTLESQVDPRFGRCAYFIIAEVESGKLKEWKAIPNPGMAAMGGAGISAAQKVADEGVKTIITGNIGPRAAAVFQQVGIQVYQATGTVKEALESWIKGELPRLL